MEREGRTFKAEEETRGRMGGEGWGDTFRGRGGRVREGERRVASRGDENEEEEEEEARAGTGEEACENDQKGENRFWDSGINNGTSLLNPCRFSACWLQLFFGMTPQAPGLLRPVGFHSVSILKPSVRWYG